MNLSELITDGFKIIRTEINDQSQSALNFLFTLEKKTDEGVELEIEIEVELQTLDADIVQIMNNELIVERTSSSEPIKLKIEDTSELPRLQEIILALK